MTILYLSGKITGEPDLGEQAFHEAALELRGAGYVVFDPTRISGQPDWGWEDYMKVALSIMMEADGVAMLPNWTRSRGAQIEYGLAQHLKMTPAPVDVWLEQARGAA